jgi:hypothetical protein
MKIKTTLLLFALFVFGLSGTAQVTVSLNVSPGTMVCDNQPVTFTATITGCPSAYTIYWKDFAFYVDTCVSPCTTWNTTLLAGNRQIWCTVDCNPNGSGNSSIINMTVDDCSGIEEYENGTLVTVYPNPSESDIILDVEKLGIYPASLSVLDGQGKMVNVRYEIKNHSAVFNVSRFKNGNYYYRIVDKDGKKAATGKFVISK